MREVLLLLLHLYVFISLGRGQSRDYRRIVLFIVSINRCSDCHPSISLMNNNSKWLVQFFIGLNITTTVLELLLLYIISFCKQKLSFISVVQDASNSAFWSWLVFVKLAFERFCLAKSTWVSFSQLNFTAVVHFSITLLDWVGRWYHFRFTTWCPLLVIYFIVIHLNYDYLFRVSCHFWLTEACMVVFLGLTHIEFVVFVVGFRVVKVFSNVLLWLHHFYLIVNIRARDINGSILCLCSKFV